MAYSPLHKLTGQFAQLTHLDLDDEAMADTLEALSGEVDDRIDGVCRARANLMQHDAHLDAEIEIRAAEIVRLREAKERNGNRRAHMLTYLGFCVTPLLKGKKRSYATANFKISMSSGRLSTQIDDESIIPENMMRQPERPPLPDKQPNRKLIAETIDAGTDVPGASRVRGPTTVKVS